MIETARPEPERWLTRFRGSKQPAQIFLRVRTGILKDYPGSALEQRRKRSVVIHPAVFQNRPNHAFVKVDATLYLPSFERVELLKRRGKAAKDRKSHEYGTQLGRQVGIRGKTLGFG